MNRIVVLATMLPACILFSLVGIAQTATGRSSPRPTTSIQS